MSFYLEDDDYDYHTKDETGNDTFVCDNCGSTHSYLDAATGGLCCTECFTQSQTQIDASQQEIEMDEAMGLAARSRGGQIIYRGRSDGRNRTGKAREKAPLENLDKTVSIPDLSKCLRGFQRVLKESCDIICDLVGIIDDADAASVLENVKVMWTAYLRSWSDGAEYYGALYPEIRFVLRDSFLSLTVKKRILSTLAHQAAERVKEDLNERKAAQQREDDMRDDDDISIYGNEDDDEKASRPDIIIEPDTASVASKANSELTDDEDDRMAEFSSRKKPKENRAMIEIMLRRHYNDKWSLKKMGRKEAALLLKPSITMVAGILLLAVSPLGVTQQNILDWISNGSLPLLNAFRLLNKEEKNMLQHVAPFFRPKAPPSMHQLQRMILGLQVACGYKPPKINIRRRPKRKPERQVRKSKSKNEKAPNEIPGRLLSPASIPMVTARWVSELKFGQTVLNFALALMGLPIAKGTQQISKGLEFGESDSWLPPALKRARPDLLVHTEHILGVIFVACKLIPGWEAWSFNRPLSMAGNNDEMSALDEEEEDLSERETKRRKSLRDQARFVPWNEQHFRLLGNGQMMEGYLEFVEEQMMEYTDVVLPNFVSSLELTDDKPMTQKRLVRPCPNLFGPLIDEERQHHRYVVTKKPNRTTLRPSCPQSGLLIEYMAYKAGAQPSEIEKAVVELEEEMTKRFGNTLFEVDPIRVINGTVNHENFHSIVESSLSDEIMQIIEEQHQEIQPTEEALMTEQEIQSFEETLMAEQEIQSVEETMIAEQEIQSAEETMMSEITQVAAV
jgi:hypothetical protein